MLEFLWFADAKVLNRVELGVVTGSILTFFNIRGGGLVRNLGAVLIQPPPACRGFVCGLPGVGHLRLSVHFSVVGKRSKIL